MAMCVVVSAAGGGEASASLSVCPARIAPHLPGALPRNLHAATRRSGLDFGEAQEGDRSMTRGFGAALMAVLVLVTPAAPAQDAGSPQKVLRYSFRVAETGF